MDSLKQKISNTFPNFYYFTYVCLLNIKPFFIHNKKKRVEKQYFKKYGVKINIDDPKSFYEKINYLKLNQFGPEFATKIDKYEVKEYLSNLGYSKYCTKTIAHYNTFGSFKKDYKNLIKNHNVFVAKLTHTSGDVFFYSNGSWRNKKGNTVSKRFVFANLRHKIHLHYENHSFEKIYNALKGSILIEEYRPSLNNLGLNEFKIFVNYGEPVLINYVIGRQNHGHVTEAFLDSNLKKMPIKQNQETIDFEGLETPIYYQKMLEFCQKTCSDLPLVRVDFMIDNDDFYFCEFTFYDCGGINIFYPLESNVKLGDLIKFKK